MAETATGVSAKAVLDERLDTAPCGFFAFDDSGTLTAINRTLLEMLDRARDELVGRHVEQILTVGSRIFYQTHWFPLLRLHGHAEEIFLMLRTRSGEDVGALVNAVRRERPGRTEYECVAMRVSERQKYEEELLRARREADQARERTEQQAEELRLANETLESQAIELELQQQQLQEQADELSSVGQALQLRNEALLARTAEAEELRVAAEEANQAKSSFLAVMSHELRTPLNAIGGYVQLLELGVHGPLTDAQREALERIDRSGRHLLGLINEVLNLARIESGRVDYVLERVAVDELIAGVGPMIEPQLASKDLRFEVEVAADLTVRADLEKAQQILLNLLSNATKFTPAGGLVRVDTATAGSARAIIRVSDTGIGIPPEKLEAIFEPFIQVKNRMAGGTEGTGLGLAISRDLARGMGGDLTARSEPGKGSTFSLTLPRV